MTNFLDELFLWEDEKEFDPYGRITHHPLNGRSSSGDVTGSHGRLTFAGQNLDQSPLLEDIRVHYLEFYGGHRDDPEWDGERWADPLRIEILKKLAGEQYHWYLSFYGALEDLSRPDGAISIDDDLKTGLLQERSLVFTTVKSQYSYWMGSGFYDRLFFELPNSFIPYVVNRYWQNAEQLIPIEGYLLEPGKIELFKAWNDKPRDDILFKEVINQVQCAFYTFAGENRNFVLLTNKFTTNDLAAIIDLKALLGTAKSILAKPG